MLGLIIGFLSSFIITLLILRYKNLHHQFTGDYNLLAPQKIHKTIVPRIGGTSVAIGISLALFFHYFSVLNANLDLVLLFCSIPVFFIGLTEDITKNISVKIRLVFIAMGAALLAYLTNGKITILNFPILDLLFGIPSFGFIFTVFAITGLTNAYNIIDGLNGLASMVGVITLLALGYISYETGDRSLLYLSGAMIAAILGFFIWNYPKGSIFLGDGGAYLIGFWIASLSVLIVSRHQEISPWFAVLANIYPIVETIFTIYRRKIYRGKNPGLPDGIHFHTIIYRRIFNAKNNSLSEDLYKNNAKTSPYLWLLSSLGAMPATLFYQSTPILVLCGIIFTIFYLWLYKKIISFRTPKWIRSIKM